VSFLAVLLVASFADAKLFRNAYVSFEMPERWECHLEGTEWVCSSMVKESAREAVIILTAKEIGPTDSFDAYEKHRNTHKKVPSSTGKPVESVVKQTKRRSIANQTWVDSLHLGSEIPNYYTRYLATVKDRLAVLVTFSAHQKYYTKYNTDFIRAVESLYIVASPDLFRQTVHELLRPGGGDTVATAPIGFEDPNAFGEEELPDEGS